MKLGFFRRREDIGPDERSDRIDRVLAVVKAGDPVQRPFMASEIAGDRCYERHGITLPPGGVVIDVGGNMGISAAHFALNCGAGAVHSFEPVPQIFEALAANLEGLGACHVQSVGLSASPGKRTMHFYPDDPALSTLFPTERETESHLAQVAVNWGRDTDQASKSMDGRLVGRGEVVECEFVRLSDFLRANGISHVDLLKVDVERAEVEVLAGIDDEHWPNIRQVVGETHDEGSEADLRRTLKSHGFEVTIGQEPSLSGTPVKLFYAIRSDSRPEG